MPFTSKKPKLALTAEVQEELERISHSRTEPAQRIERAKMLLAYVAGENLSEITRQFKTNYPRVDRCINKALQLGAMISLKDLPGRGRRATITAEARAWVVSVACQKPKDLGYSYELWTTRLLASHARKHGPAIGHSTLEHLSRGTVSKILTQNKIRPHRITYYLEQRDPQFDIKMAQVLCVYQEIDMLRERGSNTVVLSYDEKPGIQAIANTAPDLPPIPGKYPTISRDHEYVRHGTLSLLAGIDLLNGHVHGLVVERHRSREFVDFLKQLDAHYPPGKTIRMVLDNHSAHISKETRAFLSTVANRFEFIFTPKHGSWLNLIESFFGKMARTMLRGIRVASKEELKKRIEKYLAEVNEEPVVFRWKSGLDSMAVA
jgi:transposase